MSLKHCVMMHLLEKTFDNMHIKKVSFNNKPDDDDKDAACMHACKNTTINLTAAHVNQIASKVHVTEVLCDDTFVRKKCLMTCMSKKLIC